MDIQEKIKEIFDAKNLKFPESGDSPLGLDSLNLMFVIADIETAFSVKFGLNDFDEELTLNRIARIVADKK